MKDPTHMGSDELKGWLRNHLQMKGASALSLDVIHEEAPCQRPAALWKTGDDKFRERLHQVVLDLLREVAEGLWTPEAFHQLGFLIEACPLPGTATALETLARSRTLLRLTEGPRLQMMVLRTLLGLGWKGTPTFWNKQKRLIGGSWSTIIAEGLARSRQPAVIPGYLA